MSIIVFFFFFLQQNKCYIFNLWALAQENTILHRGESQGGGGAVCGLSEGLASRANMLAVPGSDCAQGHTVEANQGRLRVSSDGHIANQMRPRLPH